MFSALSAQKSMLFAPLVSTVSIRSFSPCGSACGSNQKTQRKNCAAVIKDYDYEKSTLWRSSEAHRLFRCPTDHQIEIFLQRNLASKHLATPLHGLCIRVLPLNFQRPSRLEHDPFNLVRTHSNLPANNFQNQYNSKCSWMQAADLMPLSVWTVAIFCHWKIFQNRLFKTRFSVGLNRRTFSEGRKQAAQARKCKWSVNFLEKASKNRVPVAYAVRGFFRRDTAQNANSCRIK